MPMDNAAFVNWTHGQHGIIGRTQCQTYHPERNQSGTERLVFVVHRRLLNHLLGVQLCERARDGLLERFVQIFLVTGGVLDDGGLGVFGLLRRNRWQSFSLVGSLGTP